MAYHNKTIQNPVTGQGIRFLRTARDTGGKLLEMEASYAPQSKEPAPHYHPYQQEAFTILSGEITVRIGSAPPRVLKMGANLHIPRGQVHSMWNAAGEKAVLNWQVRPAMNTEYLLETITGLAADGKTNAVGMPPLLQTALIAGKYPGVLRLARPPYIIQRILFGLLSPFAWLAGYRAVYKKYIN